MFNFHGAYALITGAGAKGGIGFETAKLLLKQGCSVSITSTTERVFERESELEALAHDLFGVNKPKIHAQIADLTNSHQIEYLMKGFDQLDVLVNNAGMTSLTNPLSDSEATDLTSVSDEAWSQGISRNLDTAFKTTRAALPLLRKSKRGRVIMVSSVTGPKMAMRNQPGYAAGKAALVGLTRAVAIDEAKYGITANAVLPGWISTDTQPRHEAEQGKKGLLRRSGLPHEVAAAIVWLASVEAGYVTGQEIVIDGGNSIAEERV